MGFLTPKTPKPPKPPKAPPEPPKITDKAVVETRDEERRRAALEQQSRPVLTGQLEEPATTYKPVLGY